MISTHFMNMVKPCWKPSAERYGKGDSDGRVDGLLWYKDLGQHINGEFSMAVIQANSLLEDQSQLESGPLSFLDSGPHGTFIGVNDGHGGPEASRFVNENLFLNLKSKLCFRTAFLFLPSLKWSNSHHLFLLFWLFAMQNLRQSIKRFQRML